MIARVRLALPFVITIPSDREKRLMRVRWSPSTMMVRTDASTPTREAVFGIAAFHDVAPSIQEICDAGKDRAEAYRKSYN